MYFPRLRFAEDDRRAELVAVLARFFSSEIGFELIKGVRTHHLRDVLVALDFTQLKARADIPDLFAALELAPPEAMLCLRAAIHEVVFNSPVGGGAAAQQYPRPRSSFAGHPWWTSTWSTTRRRG